MQEYFGFVLYLSSTDNEALIPIITRLQREYCEKPPFEPHLSIYHSVKMTSLEDTIAAVTKATKNIKSFTVESEGFGFQNIWSRILYINIKPNPILESIRKDIGNELGDKENRVFTPHISLMYKDELAATDRAKIISNLDLPATYTISGIQIVSPGSSNDDWRDYSKWKVLHSLAFSKE